MSYAIVGYHNKSKSDKEQLVGRYSKCSSSYFIIDQLSLIAKDYQCVCHTFCQDVDSQDVNLKCWKFKFVFIPAGADLEVG